MNSFSISVLFLIAVTNTSFAGQSNDEGQDSQDETEPECDYISTPIISVVGYFTSPKLM